MERLFDEGFLFLFVCLFVVVVVFYFTALLVWWIV